MMKPPTRDEIIACLRRVEYTSSIYGRKRSFKEHHVLALADAIEALLAEKGAAPPPSVPPTSNSGSMRLEGDPPYCDGCRRSGPLHMIQLWRREDRKFCTACFHDEFHREPIPSEHAWPAVFEE